MISIQLTQGNEQLALRKNFPLDSSTLRCGGNYGPSFAHITGGVTPNHLLARGVRHTFCKEILSVQPRAILQSYLDQVGKAVLTERLEDYCSLVQLPLNILTSSANLTIATVEDLQDGFDDYCDMMRSLSVTDMVRTVKVARFEGNDHIVGIYETRLMDEQRQVLPTFHSKMWIGCFDGIWKAMKIHNTTKDGRWPMLYTRLGSETWTIEE